jgi:membrane-anchored protein YejM (alkaline phosphatase superfamily)
MDIYPIESITKKKCFSDNLPCVVPVVALCEENKFTNTLHIQTEKKTYSIRAHGYKKYDYYRVDEPTTIMSDNLMVVGKPIVLKHNPKKKKLILSIFLDSFNWKVVKEKSLKECMPNTYEFFKDGLICEEYYAGSEFTYPSVASYWTGLRSSHHKLLHPNVNNAIPDDVVVFPEILQDEGYFTAKIGGNLTPEMGYIRGMHRFLYQYWQQDFYVDQAVHQTIEHMEAFKETDQYIWMDIVDLHDVAGMWDMPLSVQASCPMRVNEIDFTGKYPGTLYHTPSPNRRQVYLKEMQYVDRQLGILYRYIKENYQKDEVIVTLFSDHGNGFNVDWNQPFLSWQRQNIPLMIYGPDFSEHSCHELVESIDYGKILCHLAGIRDERLDKSDGQLPSFLGGEKKEYVFAQSQHPDREYWAFVGTDRYRFYLESVEKVEKDCRINISAGARVYLYDNQDKEIKDVEVINRCKEIVMENIKDFAY